MKKMIKNVDRALWVIFYIGLDDEVLQEHKGSRNDVANMQQLFFSAHNTLAKDLIILFLNTEFLTILLHL